MNLYLKYEHCSEDNEFQLKIRCLSTFGICKTEITNADCIFKQINSTETE